jgi:hypothetical protein
MPKAAKPVVSLEKLSLGLNDAARLIGKTPQWVRELVRNGYIPQPARGQYRATDVAQGALKFREDEDRRSSKSASASRKDDARTRKTELEIAEMEHRLIDIDEHDAVMDEVLGIVRSEFEALPAQMTRDPARRREIENKVSAVFEKASVRLGQRGEELRESGHTTEAAAEI